MSPGQIEWGTVVVVPEWFAKESTVNEQPDTSSAAGATPVTVNNFDRAESDMYFALFAERGSFSTFLRPP